MTTIAPELAPPITERAQPPPLIHLFRVKWWEALFLPKRLWRVRRGDRTLCGLACKWSPPRGPARRKGEECIVCRDLAGRR